MDRFVPLVKAKLVDIVIRQSDGEEPEAEDEEGREEDIQSEANEEVKEIK